MRPRSFPTIDDIGPGRADRAPERLPSPHGVPDHERGGPPIEAPAGTRTHRLGFDEFELLRGGGRRGTLAVPGIEGQGHGPPAKGPQLAGHRSEHPGVDVVRKDEHREARHPRRPTTIVATTNPANATAIAIATPVSPRPARRANQPRSAPSTAVATWITRSRQARPMATSMFA